METTMTTEIKKRSVNIKDVQVSKEPTIKTGNEKLDAFISKKTGFVLRSLILLTGTSGSGKTTFAVNTLRLLRNYKTILYSREMAKESIKDQTSNIIFDHNNAYIADEKNCPKFEDFLKELEVLKPKFIVIDSLQTIATEDYPDISEEAACSIIVPKLRKWAEKANGIVLLIGQVRKDDVFAGTNRLKHYVDAHCEMLLHKDGHRTISWSKNRKGGLKKLYYIFGETGLEFFTEEEWKILSAESRDFITDIISTVNGYLSTVDKSSPNYKTFKKEYNSEANELYKTFEATGDRLTYTMNLISLTQKFVDKFSV